MDRETAKQLAIAMYEDAMRVHGRDTTAVMAPCVGKCTWTYGELYDAAVADVAPENMSTTATDDMLSFNDFWVKQYGRELTIEDVKIKDGKDSNKDENDLADTDTQEC